MPEISIIIPVFNVEQYLKQCLDSIVSQDCSSIEVILIDDGSTDGSATLCKDYANTYNYIKFLRKENGGVSSARNMGLQHAKGEYVAFIDSDDWVESTYIETLLSCIHEKQPSDIVFFGEHIIQNGQCLTLLPQATKSLERSSVEEAIFQLRYGGERDVFGWTWDKIFRADIIREHHIEFHEDVKFREDELFTFEFCRYITTLQVIPAAIYNYRVREKGLTGQNISANDYLPSSISLENCLAYYQHEGIREYMIHSITSYRALHIFRKCSLSQVKGALKEYVLLTKRLPQPGKNCPIQHLTQYVQKNFWIGYFYCLIRKL